MTQKPGRQAWSVDRALPAKRSRGLRIGLFGGSFNPPHEGHRLASLVALRRLQLDRIWWLVSPGNPLKDTSILLSLEERVAAAEEVAHHPQIDVTSVETALGLRFTADVLDALVQRCPGVHFVWIMGADNLRNFHRWQRWDTIIDRMPIAVVDRPGATLKVASTRAGVYASRWQVREAEANSVPGGPTPAMVFLHGPRSTQSSTALRNQLRRDDKGGRTGS